MTKMNVKQYWIAQIDHQLYMLGSSFSREYYLECILPKLSLTQLKEFYFKMEEIDMMRSFKEGNQRYNLPVDHAKIEKIYAQALKQKYKLAEMLIVGMR